MYFKWRKCVKENRVLEQRFFQDGQDLYRCETAFVSEEGALREVFANEKLGERRVMDGSCPRAARVRQIL